MIMLLCVVFIFYLKVFSYKIKMKTKCRMQDGWLIELVLFPRLCKDNGVHIHEPGGNFA